MKFVRIVFLWQLVVTATFVSSRADVPIRERSVDVLILQDGTRIIGHVVEAHDRHTTAILVRGDWLKSECPHVYDYQSIPMAKDASVTSEVAGILENHIQQLESSRSAAIEHLGYLKEQLASLRERMAAADDFHQASVVRITVPSRLVRRQLLQKSVSRLLAWHGIINNVDGMEEMSTSDLREKLQQVPPSELQREVSAARQPNADEQANRILLHADRIFGKTSRFIRIGQRLIPADGNPDLNLIAGDVLSEQLTGQLRDLLSMSGTPSSSSVGAAEPDSQPKTVLAKADLERSVLIEVSHFDVNPASGHATVGMVVFHRKSISDSWRKAVTVRESASVSEVTDTNVQGIVNDPRVQQVTAVFTALGSNAGDLNLAMKLGAAVELARRKAEKSVENQLQGRSGGSALPSIAELNLKDLTTPTPLLPKQADPESK